MARSIQISIDEPLLSEIDNLPEVRSEGRSMLVRRVLRTYLELGQQREIDRAYEQAYAGHAKVHWQEIEPLIETQVWPKT